MKIKNYVQADKSLKGNNEYVDWDIFNDHVTLDGDFTIKELKEIIAHIKKYYINYQKFTKG